LESREPGPLPELSRFSAVVLNDVAFEDLGASSAEAIREWVRRGGALLAVGGGRSFGPGGWGGTALEEALPVRMAPREREEPRNAVALVIDKSGSMREEQRMLYAKEAARQLAERMNSRDLLTVIAFDRRAFVVVPLAEVSEVRGELETRLARLHPAGGTRLYPALIEAQRVLSDLSGRKRHVIVLSDGLSEDAETAAGQRVYYDLALALASRGVTISTIALGRQADVRFLERLASFGRGAFHQTDDPSNLPQLVLGGLEERGRETTVREERVRPQPAADSPLVGEIARAEPTWPPLFGFVETRPKPGARLDVVAPRGEPLIASWTYGAGRAVAVTTDAAGRWSDAWVRWQQWGRLWGELLRWLAPETPTARAAFAVAEEGGAMAVEATRFDSDLPEAPLAILSTETGETARSTMRRIAPGQYRAELPHRGPGNYRIEIRGLAPGPEPILLGYAVPPSATAERPRRAANRVLLEQLARATGGTTEPSREELAAPAPAEERPLAEWLLPAAIALFLASAALQRLGISS
jgi:Mg-chelatase subunit ChlD